MKRPLAVASAALLAAILLQPAVQAVHDVMMRADKDRLDDVHTWLFGDDGKPTSVQDMVPIFCDPEVVSTNTTIDEWPESIRKGSSFYVGGLVRVAGTDRPVPGVPVTIYLNETKEEPGAPAGHGVTDEDGRYRIEGRVPAELPAQGYNLVAGTHRQETRCRLVLESWSDPELDVVSGASFHVEGPAAVPMGVTRTWTAVLVDDVGTPIENATVTLNMDAGRRDAVTDAQGRANFTLTFSDAADHELVFSFDGTSHYDAATARHVVTAEWGILHLPATADAVIGRGFAPPLTVVFPTASPENATVTFTMDDAAPDAVRLGANGRPASPVAIPVNASPGTYPATVAAPFLQDVGHVDVRLRLTTHLELVAPDEVERGTDVAVAARVVDARGAPVAGVPVVLTIGDASTTARTDADGRVTTNLRPACGTHTVRGSFAGDTTRAPAYASTGLTACPFASAFADTTLGAPTWSWLLAAAALLVLLLITVLAVRAHRRRGDDGPAPFGVAPPATSPGGVHLDVVAPADDAPRIVGTGEAFTMAARAPNAPRGARLVLYAGAREATVPASGGTATFTFDAPGERSVGARLEDANGHVLATALDNVRVVHYAEEVERAYRRFLAESDLDPDRATPRRIAAAWHARHPHVDEASLWRLVSVFETADYSHHPVDRATYLTFARAHRSLTAPGVRPRA